MQNYIPRSIEQRLAEALTTFPVVALVGPRQCGKSTLARHLLDGRQQTCLLDLERPSDLRKMADAEYYLSQQSQNLVCLDEIQRLPDLFPLLRVLVDEDRRPGRFLILGSASRDLLQQSSESLAGRIVYHELTPFLVPEVYPVRDVTALWIRGGFPQSLLSPSDSASQEWRDSFIQTFLERDLVQFGFSLPSTTLRRFWTMLAHDHGQTVNYSKIGQALDVSHTTVRRWIDVLEQAFIVRVLPPFAANLKRRLVKSPKVYVRDSGLLHALLELGSFDAVMGHPVAGASWEGFAVEQVLATCPRCQACFFRTASGQELDLVLERHGKRVGVEFKLSAAPSLPPDVDGLMRDLGLASLVLVAPVPEHYSPCPGVHVAPLSGVGTRLSELLGTRE